MMRKNEFFADAVNLAVFGGRPVVHPEDLRELDTAEIAIPAGTAKYNDKKDFLQKFRDVLKEAVIKTDDRVTYVLIGVENQKSIHYAMPVKIFCTMLHNTAGRLKSLHRSIGRRKIGIPIERIKNFFLAFAKTTS